VQPDLIDNQAQACREASQQINVRGSEDLVVSLRSDQQKSKWFFLCKKGEAKLWVESCEKLSRAAAELLRTSV